ncbi:CinA family protein [Demequina oxidasica]|uniref:CinA family protein n=1 Tax=Demequina oxidasica TaxID=676199 RepID=UPI0007820661|nr:CinA family protein [Demequina oxidasica]
MWRPEPAHVLDVAREGGWLLGSAESLTGGALSAVLTAVPGASDVWRGAIVAYNADVKRDLLGVPASVLDAVGVVSADTALAMAHGARARLGVDIAVSTTGVAGPQAHGGRKVGVVFISVVGPGLARVQEFAFAGSREAVVEGAIDAALAAFLSAMGGRTAEAPGIREQL